MSDPNAARPFTITLSWAPDQNFGRVSTLTGRTPVFAIVGLIRAGEPLERIAEEFGLSVEKVTVLARLADEEWAS